MNEYLFDHEKLKVYQKALAFVEWLSEIFKKVDKKHSGVDQLDRASTSIVMNIAEGNGKYTSRDRCKYFDIVRGSTLECAGGLDILVAKNILTKEVIEPSKKMLNEIVAMLVGLIKSNSNRLYDQQEPYGGLEE